MNSKILPFNKTLLKKDWKMTKLLCFIVAGILFFTMTLGVINTYNAYRRTLKDVEEYPERYVEFNEYAYRNYLRDSIHLRFKELTGMEPGLVILMPMAVAVLLFGEEKRRKTFEVLSTMPFSRWEIFFNKVIIACVNVILPFLINAVIMIAALALFRGLRDFYSAGMVMSWFGADAFRLFVILSFSLFFASLTGTSISQLVLTVVFFIFPMGFAGLIDMNMSIWGYNLDLIVRFLDIFVKYNILGLLNGIYNVPVIYHLIWAVVMLVASKLLFDRNRLERSGEVLEFEAIETFFKVGVAGCTALLMGVIFTWFIGVVIFVSGDVPKIFTVLGYIAGIFAGWFISNYSIKSNRARA